MELFEENTLFWSPIENGLKLIVPDHIKNTLKYEISCLFLFIQSIYYSFIHDCSANGFGSMIAFEDFEDGDIEKTENFVRLQLGELLQKLCETNGRPFDDEIKRSYFGEFGESRIFDILLKTGN